MKRTIAIICLFFISISFYAQDGFKINSKKNQLRIPFKLVNNLIVLPVQINGVTLDFLLDTGVNKTILFSLDAETSIEFRDIEKIKIRGLGTGEDIDAYHSRRNAVSIGKYKDTNHEVYIILDQSINFSTQLGISVYGIIGSDFFKNDLIKIDYSSNNIYVINHNFKKNQKELLKYEKLPLSIELDKPYIDCEISVNGNLLITKLLIDSGGSDAVWLFQNDSGIKVPDLNFQDYLGKGFSGEIFGKRSRIESIKFGKYLVPDVTTSFPDAEAYNNVDLVKGRNGSIGANLIKRFNVIFDYKNSAIYLKKNSYFEEPFNYNMSGLEMEHIGMQMVEEKEELKTNLVTSDLRSDELRASNVKYKFVLKPVFIISNVRPNSPGEIAGFKKNDKLIKVNGQAAYNYKLFELIELMHSEEGKWITIEIDRNGQRIKSKFQLKKIL